MEQEERFIGVLDPRILEYVRFADFQWWEVAATLIALGALAGYALLAWVLDRRARARRLRRKQAQRMEAWLEEWELTPAEEDALYTLADSDDLAVLYALLADPVRFETAAHAAQADGTALPFLDRVREALGYGSGNLHVPVASTRQLQVGEHFRCAVWEGARPQHHYGMVTAVNAGGVALELTETGFQAVRAAGSAVELFYLRPNDIEYRFPWVVRSLDPQRHRVLLAHQLTGRGQRPRGTRLPMLRPFTVRVHTQVDTVRTQGRAAPPSAPPGPPEAAQEPPPEAALPTVAEAHEPVEQVRAALLEMSDGGFSMVLPRGVPEGAYVEFEFPLPRGRTLPVLGRVLDCRPYAGSRWLMRCELKGLTADQRSVLSQVLRLELQQRLRKFAEERRKRRQATEAGA